MRIAISTTGTTLDAWVSASLDACRQFLVVDTDTQETILVSVPTDRTEKAERNRVLLQAVLNQGADVLIVGRLSDSCREALAALAVEVVSDVEGMTVRQAIAEYTSSGATALAAYESPAQKLAIASHGDDLDATLHAKDEPCTSFVLVNLRTLDWELIRVPPAASQADAGAQAVRAAAKSGATAVITSGIRPACCAALNALGIALHIADEELTVRQVVKMYRHGELQALFYL